MGFLKKKKKAERVEQVRSARHGGSSKRPEVKNGDSKKKITGSPAKGKSFKKRFSSVFRKSGSKDKDLKKNITESRNAKTHRSHDVNILSPTPTNATFGSESSYISRPVDLNNGYEVVLNNGCDPDTSTNRLQPEQISDLLPHACGYAYEDAVKGIEHVECSPLDDWNNLIEFLMVPDMKRDMRRLVFGDEETNDTDTPPIKEIHTPPSSPIPYDEMEVEDPTFYDEQRQLNSLIDRQDDDDTLTVHSNSPSLGPTSTASAATYDRTGVTNSVASASVVSASVVSRSVVPIPSDETSNSPSIVEHNDTVLSKIIPENSPSTTLPNQLASPQAPEEELYDTSFTLRFLREVTQVGIMLEYFKVTDNDESEDNMKSALVTISVKPGVSRGSRLLEPRLCWKGMNPTHDNKDEGISISLLGVHSIHTSLARNDADDDDSPFFTITTETGDVHAFESPTLSERNYVVHGIKNVVAWLSYHLIMGNMTAGSGIVSELDAQVEESGEPPSLRTPVQAMNDLAHSFLD